MWWTVDMTKIQYGSDNIFEGDKYAILDTGTSLLTFGLSDYLDFVKKFQDKVSGFNCADVLCYSV